MAGLSGEIEEVVLALDQIGHAVTIAHIRDVHPHPIFQTGNVEETAAIFGDETVDECNSRAIISQAACHVRSDETETTGNEHVLIFKHSSLVHGSSFSTNSFA